MLASGVLDIAVGLIFLYLTMSLICSSVMEMISRVLGLRARNLVNGIRQMLDDDEIKRVELYAHPLVESLSRIRGGFSLSRWVAGVRENPSYIPARNFALALMDTIAKHERGPLDLSALDDLVAAAASAPPEIQKLVGELTAAKAEVTKVVGELAQGLAAGDAARAAVEALATELRKAPFPTADAVDAVEDALAERAPRAALDFLRRTVRSQPVIVSELVGEVLKLDAGSVRAALADALSKNGPLTFEQFERALNDLDPKSKLRRTLLAIMSGTERKFEEVRDEIESWFDESMERVSGWYKRQTQMITLLVAGALCLFANADTYTIARALSHDAALRASLSAAAEQAVKATPPFKGDAATESEVVPDAVIKKIFAAQQELKLPLGWSYRLPDDPTPAQLQAMDWQDKLREWGAKVLGILFTVFALSLGAPFWFDVLGRVVNLRATGTPPDTSAEKKAAAAK
jgi:hypothetical protein